MNQTQGELVNRVDNVVTRVDTMQGQLQVVQEEVRSNTNQPPPERERPGQERVPEPEPIREESEDDESDAEPPPPPRVDRVQRDRNGNEDGKLKHKVPDFLGKSDPEAYLEWQTNIEKIFQLHRYSEGYKVKLAINEFRLDANVWWKDLNRRM